MCAGERLARTLLALPVGDLRRVERSLAGRAARCARDGNQALAGWYEALRSIVALTSGCQAGQGFPTRASFAGIEPAAASLSGRDWSRLMTEYAAALADVEGHALGPVAGFYRAVLGELRRVKPAADCAARHEHVFSPFDHRRPD
jgi:hypothetical protein